MNNKMKYLCIFFVLLFIQSPVFALEAINEQTFPISPVEYSLGTSYQFNITCNNALEDVNAWLTFNGADSPMNNESNVFYTSLTDLAVGNYLYNFTCNDTTGNNTTNTWYYNITQASNPINLTFNNGTEYINQNITTIYGTAVNVTGTSLVGEVKLYRNGVNVTNPEYNVTLGVGNYTFKVNTTGNQNYSSNETDNFNLEVLPAQIPMILLLNGTEANKTYKIYDIANFTAIFGLEGETIYLDSNYSGWDLQNDTNSSIYNLTSLNSTGVNYYLTAYWNSTNPNYTDSSQTYFFSITDLNWSNNYTSVPSGSDYVSGTNYSFEINWTGNISTVLFESNFSGTMINYTYNYSYFYDNDTDTTNMTEFNNIFNNSDSTYWINFTDLSGGNYSYRWLVNDTNNVLVSTQWDYIISPILTSVFLSISDSLTTPSSDVTLTCVITPYTANLSLSIIGTTCTGINRIPSCTITSPSTVGLHNYTCDFIGNENYTASSDTKTLEVAEADWGDYSPGSPGDGQDTGQFTITPSNSKVTVNTGSSKIITFTLKNTYSNDINVTSITVSGISADWYSLDKTTISRLQHHIGSETITMTLNIPDDAELKKYQIKVKASGKNLFNGASLTKETTVELTISTATPQVEEETFEVVIAPQENITSNETEAGPTGFLPLVSKYFPYLVLLLGAVTSILIFVKRDAISYILMKTYGRKAPKKLKKKKTKTIKLPSVKDFNYKLSLSLKKLKRGRKSKALEIPKEKPEELKREIKRDIRELQNLLEAEKRIKKRRK